jgi:hypothetical protein
MTTLPDKAQAAKKAEKIGEVIVTFFQDRTYEIEMSGIVTSRDLRRCQRPMAKAANRNKIARRRESASKLKKLEAKALRIAEAAKKKADDEEAKRVKSAKPKGE